MEDEQLQSTAAKKDETDLFVYFKSSSIISILILVIVSLVCVLTTSILVRSALYSHGIARTLSIYFGFQSNRTIDESVLTFWAPERQPIETRPATISSSSTRPPPPILLSRSEKKAQVIFRNIVLPCLFVVSICCGVLAYQLRRHHHFYPAWGARPKKPSHHITLAL